MIGESGRTVACLAIVLALGLGGCAHDEDAPAAVTERQTAQPAPPPAVPAPSALPITTERSREGAQEFVKYWFAALNFALATGDVAPLSGASSPTCAACVDAAASIRNSYADGGSLRGGTYTLRSVQTEEFSLDDRPLLSTFFDRSARSGLGPSGQLTESIPAASFIPCQVSIEWTGTGWRTLTVTGELLPPR